MIYLEYETCKEKYFRALAMYDKALTAQERLLSRIMPSAIRYDRDSIKSSPKGNMLDDYLISLEDKHINERLNNARKILEGREKLLQLKEEELRKSLNQMDILYTLKYIEGYGVSRIARKLNYSKSQVYRKIKQIAKMRQNAKKIVI